MSLRFEEITDENYHELIDLEVKSDQKMLLWLKKDVGANVGGSGRPKRHKGSVGNA